MEVQSNMELQFFNVTFVSGGLGFFLGRYPPILCYGFSNIVVFYSMILPIILISAVGLPELLVIFFTMYQMVRNSQSLAISKLLYFPFFLYSILIHLQKISHLNWEPQRRKFWLRCVTMFWWYWLQFLPQCWKLGKQNSLEQSYANTSSVKSKEWTPLTQESVMSSEMATVSILLQNYQQWYLFCYACFQLWFLYMQWIL